MCSPAHSTRLLATATATSAKLKVHEQLSSGNDLEADQAGQAIPMGMKELQAAISETYVAASKIASVEHVLALESKLRSSLVEFTLTADNEFENIDSGPGVYFFDIQFPFKTERELYEFAKAWGTKGAASLQRGTSRSYPTRVKQQIARVEAGEPISFYLGKNKNIRSRVKGHLTGKAEQGTYGLKLLSRTALLKECKLRASGVSFQIVPEAYFCVQLLESALRERLHPIVGKQ